MIGTAPRTSSQKKVLAFCRLPRGVLWPCIKVDCFPSSSTHRRVSSFCTHLVAVTRHAFALYTTPPAEHSVLPVQQTALALGRSSADLRAQGWNQRGPSHLRHQNMRQTRNNTTKCFQHQKQNSHVQEHILHDSPAGFHRSLNHTPQLPSQWHPSPKQQFYSKLASKNLSPLATYMASPSIPFPADLSATRRSDCTSEDEDYSSSLAVDTGCQPSAAVMHVRHR